MSWLDDIAGQPSFERCWNARSNGWKALAPNLADPHSLNERDLMTGGAEKRLADCHHLPRDCAIHQGARLDDRCSSSCAVSRNSLWAKKILDRIASTCHT